MKTRPHLAHSAIRESTLEHGSDSLRKIIVITSRHSYAQMPGWPAPGLGLPERPGGSRPSLGRGGRAPGERPLTEHAEGISRRTRLTFPVARIPMASEVLLKFSITVST